MEFRQASKAWAESYIRHEHVDITPSTWELNKPRAPEVDVLFICMRLHTMSRARELDVDGPGLLRTRRWPWGIPEIGGTARSALETDNGWIRLALSAIREVSSRASHPTIMWVASENRGGIPQACGSCQSSESFQRQEDGFATASINVNLLRRSAHAPERS